MSGYRRGPRRYHPSLASRQRRRDLSDRAPCGRRRVNAVREQRGTRGRDPMNEELKPQILVVDDEPQMRKFVRLALSSHGYRVLEAGNAVEGIQQATSYAPDVVLLDLGLPDKDGIEVVKLLREWSAMPILIIS